MTYDNAAVALPAHQAERPFSGAAITGFIFSVLWLGGLGSIVGLFLAISAMRETRTGQKAGRGLAVAALIVSILGLLTSVVVIAMTIIAILGAGNEITNSFNDVSRSIP